ncbi:hypothetical protein JCM10908_005511 [Rhodotorula pacifica]|uniref:uncharacterized protein n=1 Tax=Rhodotorula pacifica TaxID=1495444 RepID=UPI00316BDE75
MASLEAAQLVPAVQTTAVPSSKALGKRRLDEQAAAAASPPAVAGAPQPAASAAATLAKAVQKRERRVTRSSRGGAAEAGSPGNSTDGDGNAQPRYLPARTRIRLIEKAPHNLIQLPTFTHSHAAQASTSTDAAAASASGQDGLPAEVKQETVASRPTPEKPLFRLLDETELLPPRGTRHAAAEIDTSDAFYHRLHRYPEVLEKRAARLERERLIHERSKLINELEELRGRTWVYAGTSAGGRAEEERQRRIKAMGEKLARYDALLPNQPRKSNFLNLAGAGAVPGPSNPAAARDTRTASPSLYAPVPSSRSRSLGNNSTSRPHPPVRPSTPVSASVSNSSGNKTTIRIKFGPPSTTTSPHPHPHTSSAVRGADFDLERYTVKGELRKGPKRDRKAERERAEERRKLGLKPRSSIDKATAFMASPPLLSSSATAAGARPPLLPKKSPVKRARRSSRAGVSYAESDEEEDDDEQEDEDEDEGEDEDALMQDGTYATQNGSRPAALPAKLVRKRLPDSFFHSAALRDSVMAAQGPNARRASSRVSYAFGQRLPDQALVRQVEFELHGGIANDAEDDEEGHTRTTLEEMVRLRMERHGEEAVVLGGHVLPKSAVDAWSKDPLHISPLVTHQRTQSNVSETATSSNGAGSLFAAPLQPIGSSNLAHEVLPIVSRAISPELVALPTSPDAAPVPHRIAWASPRAGPS